MAYSIYRTSDRTSAYVVELVADLRKEIDKTAAEYDAEAAVSTEFTPGSTCIVTEDSSVWMLGNDKEWYEI